ncbi:pirin family protein [Roseiterribacter gracilis]|uniref:Quercetin 2,3-dioxygenase n=1 Tax=Roseiterribacter gracilis TaxID=2812848 RepID=A0A8S8XHK1_9PROT|nr:quercetin 2,3-dioxygenase [Rhodospirillales bacterium TMPK1]
MIALRPAAERGHVHIGWLDSKHSFSFGEYYDPRHQGWGPLRVINDDRIAAGAGFPTHPHRDMEIITYVLDGAVAHRDSSGGEGVIPVGDVQRMSAGSGIQHSEFNASSTDALRLLQIWIIPDRRGVQPGYQQIRLDPAAKRDALKLIASKDGADGALTIQQDARVYASELSNGAKVRHELAPGRRAWVQVAKGNVTLNGQTLVEGDGAAIEEEPVLELSGAEGGGEVLLFDLP